MGRKTLELFFTSWDPNNHWFWALNIFSALSYKMQNQVGNIQWLVFTGSISEHVLYKNAMNMQYTQ